jgi:two-component system sensor histidine kinase SenX3
MLPVVALLAAALVAVVIASYLARRRVLVRMAEAAGRLGGDGVPKRSLEEGVARIEALATQRQSEGELVSETGLRFEAALSAMNGGTVICDHTGTEVYRNLAAQSFAEGRHGNALVEAAVVEGLAAARNGTGSSEQVELFGPPRRVMSVVARPLLRAGELVGAVAVIDDVSEARRLNDLRRDFVANVSHELRTPVGAISLLTETMTDETDPQTLVTMSQRVHGEAVRLQNLVEDLLDLSRTEGGHRSDDQVDVGEVVGRAVEQVSPLAAKRSIEVRWEPTPGVSMQGDATQIGSAVQNLLENAIKYSPEDSMVEVRVASSVDDVAIAVQDHGSGIPQADQERIFERFYRVDRGRSRSTGGTGLGLAIVRHVAENHGGSVELTSREGAGSTFTLCLARSPESHDDASTTPTRAPQ